MLVHAVPVTSSTVVVAVDVAKTCVALSVTDTVRHRLLGPVEFAMTAPALSAVVDRIVKVLPDTGALVKIGVEAGGSPPPADVDDGDRWVSLRTIAGAQGRPPKMAAGPKSPDLRTTPT